MRKILYIVALLALIIVPAQADSPTSPSSPHEYIASTIDSVCRIEIYQGDVKVGAGSGFVVETDAECTKIVTARHVVDTASKCGIVLHGKTYITAEFFKVSGTDAAMIFVKPGIQHAKALKFNLDRSTAITQVNAFGFWGLSRIPKTPQMLTLTSGWVDRKVIDKYGAPDYEVIEGLIMGNVLIFPGYSGGPLLNNKMEVIGVNIILSKKHTLFVDGRHLWNAIAHLNKGRKVLVPYAYDYDVLNIGSHQRVPVVRNDSVENNGDKTSFDDIRTLVQADIDANGRPGYPPMMQMPPADVIKGLFNDKTVVHIGGTKYLIASVAILSKGIQNYGYSSPHPSALKYVYYCFKGGEVVLELAQYSEDAPDENVKKESEAKTFFQNLTGRHFK
jgi:hypothetical protein